MMQQDLTKLFQTEFNLCKVRQGETAIVLSGVHSSPAYVQASVNALRSLGAKVFEMRMPALPPGDGAEAIVGLTPLTGQRLAVETLKKADFIVDLMFLLHSPEQVEILEAGTRILLIVEPPEILSRMFPTDDLRRGIEAGEVQLKKARTLHITSPAGTDLEMAIGDYPVITQYGYTDEPGRWDHWPSAFLYTWPNEDSTNGRVVLNKGDFIWPFNHYVENAITLTIQDGYIRKIEGQNDARLLREKMESFNDPEAFAVSHIGWGLDRRAQWSQLLVEPGSVGMDPRSHYGNVQFSTGPNTEAGGTRHTLAHFDMPMLGCTLTLDGQPVVLDGQVVAG
jgi:2,5-dihydroxypyridine 5,6-dioxygenase